jgi:hypothetical protein
VGLRRWKGKFLKVKRRRIILAILRGLVARWHQSEVEQTIAGQMSSKKYCL